jgi:hypothetical protein
MKKSKCKNPVLPPVGPIPVVVTTTYPIQNGQLSSGIFLGVESSTIPKGGWREYESFIPKGGFRGSESEIPKGGWRFLTPVLRDVYRATTGHLFEFAFYLVRDRYYEIDILSMPDYGVRDSGDHPTHRLKSNHGNDTRICFGDDSSASTLEDAQKWAAKWAEQTMNYINHGIDFPNE